MSVFGTPVITGHIVPFVSGVSSVSVNANTHAGDMLVVATFGANDPSPSMSDTIGNSYTLAPTDAASGGNSFHIKFWHVFSSIGTNATNSVKFQNGTTVNSMGIIVWDVPITGSPTLSRDANAAANTPAFATNPWITTNFNTTGTDEMVFGAGGCDLTSAQTFTAGGTYTLDINQNNGASLCMGGEHILFSSTQTGINTQMGRTSSSFGCLLAVAIKAVAAAVVAKPMFFLLE